MSALDDFVTQHGVTRRAFLQAGGALIVAVGAPGCATTATTGTTATTATPVPVPEPAAIVPGVWPASVNPASLDSWLRIAADGGVTASVGKIDAGMGVGTSLAQIVAEELDVPLARVTIVMGDTATTVDQRGTGSSNGIIDGGAALRRAGAQGRAALVAMAAKRLDVATDALRVREGVVFVAADPARRVSYGELIGSGQFGIAVDEKVATKPPSEYAIAGKPVPRMDIPPKVAGTYAYVTDEKVPGMLHARVIRPPQANARLVAVTASTMPGLVQVVREGDFLAVVCTSEPQAVAAARALEAKWQAPAEPPFWSGYDALFAHLRESKPRSTKAENVRGDVDVALERASRRLEAAYEYPFQSHASMGPACAVADVRDDGAALVWFGGQKPYPLRHAVADLLKVPAEKVRVMWRPGPGSYGMNDADDCAMDAVFISRAIRRPVRVQYSRADGTAWDPKGPPLVIRMRAGLNGAHEVFAWDYEARGFSGRVRSNSTDVAGDALVGQLIGGHKARSTDWPQFSAESYGFPNMRRVSHTVDWNRSMSTGLRTAHLRDPDGMATCFASESFADEVAYAAGLDPVAFRLRYLTDARDRAVVRAAAEKASWQPHTAPRAPSGKIAKGQGIAYAPRAGTIVAVVAEVEVDRATGRFRVTRFTCAHDCGFVVNPLSLRGTIEANLVQAMSRTMHEAVRFDAHRVLSEDWLTYPIVDMTDVPDAIDIVMVNNRPEARSRGAGEPSTRPVAAAIANALHDALGVRVRRVPFTPDAVLAALKA